MRIDKISIDHFRCFEHKEISFHPQFNVIIGENGLGKTAVVDAIAYLLNPYRHGLASNGLLEIKQKDIRRVRFGRTEEVSEKDTVLAIEIKDFFTDNERHDIAWTLQQNINVSYFYDSQYQEAQNKVRNIILPKGVSMLKKYPIIAYYPANRIAPQTSKIAAEQIAPNGSRFDPAIALLG